MLLLKHGWFTCLAVYHLQTTISSCSPPPGLQEHPSNTLELCTSAWPANASQTDKWLRKASWNSSHSLESSSWDAIAVDPWNSSYSVCRLPGSGNYECFFLGLLRANGIYTFKCEMTGGRKVLQTCSDELGQTDQAWDPHFKRPRTRSEHYGTMMGHENCGKKAHSDIQKGRSLRYNWFNLSSGQKAS